MDIIEEEYKGRLKELAELSKNDPLFIQAVKVARFDRLSVLLTGESGTGKEIHAYYIHQNSPRANKPFKTINASAFPENLLESELFGHVKGAYTDAHSKRNGLFKEADGGTLFLDEIGDMSLNTQTKLLRTLQSGEIKPIGSDKVEFVDVRIIAATNVNLFEKISTGKFREDFYHRLRQAAINIPPFREKSDDEKRKSINYIIHSKAEELKSNELKLSEPVLQVILNHKFEGNYRELENLIVALYLKSENNIEVDDVLEITNNYYCPSDTVSNSDKTHDYFIPMTLDEHIMATVHNTIIECEGNKNAAARKLIMDIKTLNRWNKKYMNRVSLINTIGKNTIG